MAREVRTLAVVGAGTMGRGIAQLAAQRGLQVILHDALEEALAGALGKIGDSLRQAARKGALSDEQAERALARMETAREFEELKKADFVIEAVSEELPLKQELFKDLARLFPGPETILATNTSSLSVGAIAEGVVHAGRVVGMHFFNPPVAMRLVELVRHARTTEESFGAAQALARRLGREPVTVADTPGFLVNRVVRSYYLVAQRIAAQGAGSFAEIDAAVKARGELPMGPFELMDFIGLEVNLAISRSIYAGLGEPERLKPHPIQEALVARGLHGRKSGEGFYLYAGGAGTPRENPAALALLPKERGTAAPAAIWESIMTAIGAEADLVVAEGVADAVGVDTAVRLAMRFPQGPFEWRRSRGV